MRPFPWFWLIRFALSAGAVAAWGLLHPAAPVWQLFLVCFAVIIGLEGMRYGYRQEQGMIARRRAR